MFSSSLDLYEVFNNSNSNNRNSNRNSNSNNSNSYVKKKYSIIEVVIIINVVKQK